MKYTEEQINQINNAIPLVKYAEQYFDFIEIQSRSNEKWLVCPLHEGDLNPSMSINTEKNVFKCLGCGASGMLINFVMQYHKLSFPKAINHILSLVNLKLEPIKPSNMMDYLHKTKRKSKSTRKIIEREYLPEDIMNKYSNKPIVEWINEGLTQEVADLFQIRYDESNSSIVFPVRDSEGRIISIKSRTLLKNHADLGISKYIYYNSIGTNNFLFGLYENRKNIEEKKEVLVVEAEKGVMLLRSFGFDNAVSICAKELNQYQIDILLSLKCKIIFAYDKDVKKNEIIKLIKPLSLFTNVEYLYDENNLTGEKESPYDRGIEVWKQLYEGRIRLR